MSFKLGDRVAIRSTLNEFHYSDSPFASFKQVLAQLQSRNRYGVVKRVDVPNNAVGVLFAGMKELLWFKTYELRYS